MWEKTFCQRFCEPISIMQTLLEDDVSFKGRATIGKLTLMLIDHLNIRTQWSKKLELC